MITAAIYKLLLLIEGLQFFWYFVHEDFEFLWHVNFSDWMRQVVKYLQFDELLTKDNQSFFVAALYVVFGIQVIIILMALFTTIRLVKSNKKTSTILAYSLKILSIYGMLLNTIFALPFFHIFISALYCKANDTIHGSMACYSGTYFVHFVVAIFGIIIMLVTSLLFNILFIDLNPCSHIPFAAPQSRLNLFKLALKIALPIYSVIDNQRGASKEFIAIYGIIWLLILVLRYRQTPYYNRSVFNFILGIDSMLFWAAIVANCHAFVDSGTIDETGLFFLFIAAIPVAYAFITLTHRRTLTYRRMQLKNFKKDTDVEMYINIVFDLIEHRDKPDEKMALEGLLKFYIKHSNKKENECASFSLARDFTKEEEAPEKLWYTWVKTLLVDALEKFPKSARLHLLYSYIQREKLHNKFKALFEMMITEDNKPNMEEEFSIYRYKNLIEEEMIENDARNSESKGIDVNIIVHFQNKFVQFQSVIEKAVELHLDFWRELLENNPDIQKLQGLGSHITHSVEETSDQFKKLNEINPNHIKMLQIYGNFLKDIVNDEVEGQRILEKADYVDKNTGNKQFIDNDRLKYGENSNTCILTCSGNFNSMGLITNVNNEINRILNFSKTDLIGQNISRIMPKVLADLHDGFMRHYFETSEPKVIGIERIVFPVNKNGYVVPCTLMIKVLPNLDEGIRLVGFLKDIEKDSGLLKNADFDSEEQVHYLIYSGDTGAIHGITPSCRQEFGIPSSLVYGANAASNEFTIDAIFPELLTHNIEELKSSTGVVTVIDTSALHQNYLIAQAESQDSAYEEDQSEDKERRYRKSKVRVLMIQDEDHADVNVKVLKFVELQEDGEYRKEGSLIKQESDKGVEKAKEHNEEEAGKDEEKDQPSVHEDLNQSDGSSISAADSVNEDIRALKDFKALISEKTTPKSIKVLSRAVGFIFVLLIVLTSVELSFKFKQSDEFEQGVTTVTQGFQRHTLMAEINYKIRKLELLSRFVWGPTDLILQNETAYGIKDELIVLIDSLSSVQFEIMKATEILKADGVDTIDSQRFPLEHKLEEGERTEDRIYTDSIFQYITAASSIRNSSLTSLAAESIIDSTRKNFFFVRRNGLGPLRNGSEMAAEQFFEYYIDKSNSYDNAFQAIMISGIVLLFLSELILIPIVFSVHKTNNRVLSLFGHIPLGEIGELASKCERYMENYLEDHKERRDYSFEASEEDIEPNNRSHNGENTYLEVSQNPEAMEGEDMNQSSVLQDVSENMIDNPVGQIPQANALIKGNTLKPPKKGGDASKLDIISPNSSIVKPLKAANNISRIVDAKKIAHQLKEDERKNYDAEMEADFAENRSQKLLNSRDNRRSKVILQFTFIMLLFVTFFVADYLNQVAYLNNVKNGLDHLKLSGQRMPNVRYVMAFTLEEIAEGERDNVYVYPNTTEVVDLRVFYRDRTEDNDKDIKDSQKETFPGQYDSYLTDFNQYNNEDLCDSYYKANPENLTAEACLGIANGLLAKGLSVAITTVTLNSNDVLKDFNETDMEVPAQKATITGDKFIDSEDIVENIMEPMGKLITEYNSASNSYLGSQLNVDRIKFTVFILFCVFVFGILWIKYLKGLNDKIFRTKGMLNMIPMDIISKNENLKGLFVSGDILQAVK